MDIKSRLLAIVTALSSLGQSPSGQPAQYKDFFELLNGSPRLVQDLGYAISINFGFEGYSVYGQPETFSLDYRKIKGKGQYLITCHGIGNRPKLQESQEADFTCFIDGALGPFDGVADGKYEGRRNFWFNRMMTGGYFSLNDDDLPSEFKPIPPDKKSIENRQHLQFLEELVDNAPG